jgi:hypothetical protein
MSTQYVLVLVFTFFVSTFARGQELNVEVNVSTPQLTTVDPKVFDQLKSNIENLYSSTRWTDVDYSPEERIEVTMQINIKSDNDRNQFKADIQFQTNRPVYGSDYLTPVISFVDKNVNFKFDPFQPMQKSTNNYINQLSSLLSYYAYIFLAYDYETFSSQGGSKYLTIALEVANAIPNATAQGMGGWLASAKSNQGRTRHSLLENLQNSRMVEFRNAMYIYHRKGLDLMSQDPEQGRQNILTALEKISEANSQYFNSLVIQMFCNAKRKEMIEIFKGAGREERLKAHDLLTDIDASNSNDYSELSS